MAEPGLKALETLPLLWYLSKHVYMTKETLGIYILWKTNLNVSRKEEQEC